MRKLKTSQLFTCFVLLLLTVIGLIHLLPSNPANQSAESHNDVNEEEADVESQCNIDRNITTSTGSRRLRVAIGGAVTKVKEADLDSMNISRDFPFFASLLPSFCNTSSLGYEYRFYLAYDFSDLYYADEEMQEIFYQMFEEIVWDYCDPDVIVDVALIPTTFEGTPGYSHSQAMMEAYLDDFDYYYRINDDTILLTWGWTEAFIGTLAGFWPPNVGVVGPLNVRDFDFDSPVLTYDFTHRTHMEIFGIYYPRGLKDQWLGSWVTHIYEPDQSIQHPGVEVRQPGMRHEEAEEGLGETVVTDRIRQDSNVIHRYIRYLTSEPPLPDPSKVIAMPLWGSNFNYTYNAIRNAQLAPVVFPGWTLQFYIPRYDTSDDTKLVPQKILETLKRLGAQIEYIDDWHFTFPLSFIANLVADDPNVDYFVVRNVDEHLSDRQNKAVMEWMDSGKVVHCIRDHDRHANTSIIMSLYAADTKQLRKLLKIPMSKFLDAVANGDTQILKDMYGTAEENLTAADVLWHVVSSDVMCHDSVSCQTWQNSIPYPWKRGDETFDGMNIDGYMQPAEPMKAYDANNKCAGGSQLD